MRRGDVQSLKTRRPWGTPSWLAGAVLALVGAPAQGAPCGHPDLLETLPPDGAADVPINAALAARYAPSAEYLNEPVVFEHVGVGEEMAAIRFDLNEGLLTIEPAAPLVSLEPYKVHWPQLRGLSTASLGTGADVGFTAGAIADMAPPNFSGVRSLDWDVERANDECSDAADDRFRFDLTLDEATDDGGNQMLTLVVFQTAGPSLAAGEPPLPVLVQRFPPAGKSVRVERPIDVATGRVCFAAIARDARGQISQSAQREVCARTVKPPFFYGCGLAADSGRGEPSTRTLLFFAGVFVVHARRKRKRHA